MKVIVKRPQEAPEIIEVESLKDINKLVHNVDKDGNGLNKAGSDIRCPIGMGVDEYVKEDAINNFDFEPNLWATGNNAIFFGTVVFAGYDQNKDEDFGACSLSDEQIQYCLQYIALQAY